MLLDVINSICGNVTGQCPIKGDQRGENLLCLVISGTEKGNVHFFPLLVIIVIAFGASRLLEYSLSQFF